MKSVRKIFAERDRVTFFRPGFGYHRLTRKPKAERRMNMAEMELTSRSFDSEVLNSDKPVLVDFWASWCGPCRMLAPVLAEIARERAGSVKVAKVNVDEEPALANRFRVSSIPTVLVFKDGKIVNSSVGFRPKAAIEALLP